MRSFVARIDKVICETSDTVSVVLDADSPRDYRAGQFLNVDPHQIESIRSLAVDLEQRKCRKERPRAYSLASAPFEPQLVITIKAEGEGEFPALLSPYFVQRAAGGDLLHCTGFAGLYTLPADLPADAHVVHLCAGSGIVPNFSIIKDALHRRLPQRHTLLCSNRRWDDVIFRHELTALAKSHADRLRIVHTLTRDGHSTAGAVVGRIDERRIREHVPDLDAAWFFICGPSTPTHERAAARKRGEAPAPRFLESMKSLVLAMGVQKQRIHAEGW